MLALALCAALQLVPMAGLQVVVLYRVLRSIRPISSESDLSDVAITSFIFLITSCFGPQAFESVNSHWTDVSCVVDKLGFRKHNNNNNNRAK